MTRRSLIALVGVTVALLAVWVLLPQRQGPRSTSEPGMLMPDLAEQVNDLDWLQISTAESAPLATLARVDNRWVVNEAAAYSADWETIRALLLALSQARVVEPKTSNSDYYARLAVEDLADAEAGSEVVRVSLSEATGLPAVLVGKEASGREGQYARLEGQSASFLLDRVFDIPIETGGWLDSEIVDVADAEVVEVEVVHADGDTLKATKVSADDSDFSLQGIPAGREIKSAWSVNSLAGLLAALELDDVSSDWPEAAETATQFNYRVLTADGLEVSARLLQTNADESGNEHWISLQAVAVGDQPAVETIQRAEEINQRTGGWAYRIPQYKFSSVNKRMADVLTEVASPGSEDEG